MLHDDVLSRCPDCGSSYNKITKQGISCLTCGLTETFGIEDEVREGLQETLVQALDKGKMRDVLLRWSFAG